MIAAVYDWSGFYIGANGGWGSSRKCWDITTDARRSVARVAEGCHDATGGTAGGQIGYRWQAGTWVFGVEAQGNWADFSGSQCQPVRPALRQSVAQDRCLRPVHRPDRLRLPTTSCSTSRAARPSPTIAYRGFDVPTGLRALARPRKRNPLGRRGRCRPRIRLLPELVGRRSNTITCSWATAPTTSSTGASRRPWLSRTDRISQDVDLVTVRVNYRWGGPVIAKY